MKANRKQGKKEKRLKILPPHPKKQTNKKSSLVNECIINTEVKDVYKYMGGVTDSAENEICRQNSNCSCG